MQTIIACNICGRACCAPDLHSESEQVTRDEKIYFDRRKKETREVTVIYGKDLV